MEAKVKKHQGDRKGKKTIVKNSICNQKNLSHNNQKEEVYGETKLKQWL